MIRQLNQNAKIIVQHCIDHAELFRIQSLDTKFATGQIVDFGVDAKGGLEAGIQLTRICMSDLGDVSLIPGDDSDEKRLQVNTEHPGLACMGSQYGGWPVKTDEFFAIGSGPIRLQRGKEPVLERFGWSNTESEFVVAVLESARLPDESVIQYMADECNIDPSKIVICVAPTKSMAGSVQIVGRCVEATMHKLFELDVDLTKVTKGSGTAPLPTIASDDLVAIGRTNDSILYGARVLLWVDMSDDEITELGPKVPSNSSPDYGKPFGELFKACGGDFYKLDPMLFSAAKVTIVSNRSGNQFTFGEIRSDIYSW